MSEQQTYYVVVDYKDPHGRDHVRGDKVSGDPGDSLVSELVYRGVLSTSPVRRQAGENSGRVTGDRTK